MASMLMNILNGFDRLIRIVSVDLHSGQLQGFTSSKMFDNLYANFCLRGAISELLIDKYSKEQVVIVSPDTGSVRRTRDYLKDLSEFNCVNVMISKTRSLSQNNVVESSMISECDLAILKTSTSLIIDDMIDTAGTICSTVGLLTIDGILSDPAIDRLNKCELITDVIITDTVDQIYHLERCPKLRVVSVAPLIARCLYALFVGKSLSTLYK